MGKIAFIPLRGGSKSIPRKNIRLFCGKPLIYWNLSALCKSGLFDSIVVATDDDQIEEVVNNLEFKGVEVYRRSKESATDTASTEIVVLEFLEYSLGNSTIKESDVLVLVQATSPLTRSNDFLGALDTFYQGGFDSVLTCVRIKNFLWTEDGIPMNYDYMNRPRRQEFSGNLMENGAIYVSRVKNVLESGNRLSGKIGIYEMPEYTRVEIDEEEDWLVAENLMRRYAEYYFVSHDRVRIKLLLSDVDGVLTDSGMYYTNSGDELKKFNTRDGMGFNIIRRKGIKTGIITTENTKIVENRAAKLNLDYLLQGVSGGGKLEGALQICRQEGISIQEVAYIGDDINCRDLLACVGFAACPSDALDEIKAIPGIRTLSRPGGEGVVREFIELLIKEDLIWRE